MSSDSRKPLAETPGSPGSMNKNNYNNNVKNKPQQICLYLTLGGIGLRRWLRAENSGESGFD